MNNSAGTYYEPFVGGGSLFFDLFGARSFLKWAGGKRSVLGHIRPFVPKMNRAILSDTNTRLIRTYKAVRNDVESVVRELKSLAKRNEKEGASLFSSMRELDIDAVNDDFMVAAWFIYLNKTGFNGLYRVNKSGKFNVPYGRYTSPVICDEQRLVAASEALKHADILDLCFEHVLDSAVADDFIYFDPPYIPLSKTASFTAYGKSGFGIENHRSLSRIAEILHNRGCKVLLSNSDTPEVRALYNTWEFKEVSVARAIAANSKSRAAVGELLIYKSLPQTFHNGASN